VRSEVENQIYEDGLCVKGGLFTPHITSLNLVFDVKNS